MVSLLHVECISFNLFLIQFLDTSLLAIEDTCIFSHFRSTENAKFIYQSAKLKMILLFEILQWLLLFHFPILQKRIQFKAPNNKKCSFFLVKSRK